MASQVLAVVLATMLLGVFVATGFAIQRAYADDSWWVGKGAKADTHVNYRIQYRDLNDGRPFILSIYFQKQDSSGHWIAPAWVEDNGKVINGTLVLGDNLSVLRTDGANIPPEMNQYLSAYANTLQWLNAFSPQSQPKHLSDRDWGKLACIGCGDLIPSGQESVTTDAGTFTATVLINHYGQSDSKIWVNQDMPYPVKSVFYVGVTTGNPPIQYAYDLIDQGTGPSPQPKAFVNIPKPPISHDTVTGQYTISLDWEPVDIRAGGNTTFGVSFADSKGPLENVNYQITVKDGAGNVIKQINNQNTQAGVGKQTISFDKEGPVKMTVTLNAVQGVPSGEFIQAADFDLVVQAAIPEFPLGAVIGITAVLGAVVLLTRSGLLGDLFGSKKDSA